MGNGPVNHVSVENELLSNIRQMNVTK